LAAAPSTASPADREQEEPRARETESESGRVAFYMGGGMVFEPHTGAGGDDNVMFCVTNALLTLLSTVIFTAAGEGKRPRWDGRGSTTNGSVFVGGKGCGCGGCRAAAAANGPVFVGGKGCGCGGCRVGTGVCSTYLANGLARSMRTVGANGSADGSIHISIVVTWITWCFNGASVVDPRPCIFVGSSHRIMKSFIFTKV
jgi:hypothetical protein